MVKIVHSLGDYKKEKKAREDIRFLIANRKGGYFCLANENKSRYDGLFFFDEKMYKIIESLHVIDSQKVSKITNKFYSVERECNNITETFFMPHYYNSLVYEINKVSSIEVVLDAKESYDQRKWGRFYSIWQEGDKVIVKFTKKTDAREDNSEGKEEYFLFLVLKFEGMFKKVEEWEKRDYEFDKKRNSKPYERYVFSALSLKTNKVVISISKNKENAKKEADYVFKNVEILRKNQKEYYDSILNSKKSVKNDISIAYSCAINSLNSLIVDDKGIFAGLPWFFQFWTRDEAISSKALMLQENFDLAKNILFRHLKSVLHDGKLPTKPNFSLRSADSAGWISKRAENLICILKNKSVLKKYFTKNEIKKIKERIEHSLDFLIKYHTRENLVFNNAKETWMDSLQRGGFRIEIQAMQLSMYKLMHDFTNNNIYQELKNNLKKEVRKRFWNKKWLADGLDDFTIRPNVFIAYYMYPELLTKKEWVICFDTILKHLWNSWGGISTIDKKSEFFISEHTGEINNSYHNGDSWFWINNLAAICLYKLDKKRFKKYIDKILQASTKEILWQGAIGHHAELSSSKELRSEGCPAQAWSAAMYIELINEIYK
jgi:glycogen debranching enzyme